MIGMKSWYALCALGFLYAASSVSAAQLSFSAGSGLGRNHSELGSIDSVLSIEWQQNCSP